ncbi:Tyrosine aminotransferase [Hypsibius exemplaris]|uniref:Tyrosine aminotransferase n=1 Tax=Hypsibius exemplaris TaxID=2072580 RepID=A0A9X6NEW0_HYPEX|nr:Tyrosine aminotransferase [Hypsibius exemplaris]
MDQQGPGRADPASRDWKPPNQTAEEVSAATGTALDEPDGYSRNSLFRIGCAKINSSTPALPFLKSSHSDLRKRASVYSDVTPTTDIESDCSLFDSEGSFTPPDDSYAMQQGSPSDASSLSPGGRAEWKARSSYMAKNTLNPIRKIVDGMKLTPNPEKAMIALSIGDPTIYKNFSPPEEAVRAVKDAADSKKFDGYAPSTGILSAREAVADYASRSTSPVTAKDVILTSGASHALELSISVLCDRGSNLLIPCPGFSIYKTIACSLGVECRSYRLQPELDWEIDLDQLASLIDADTAAIVVNNPSNPCGSVYTKEHLQAILEVADYYKVPVIADEIYDDLVFPGHVFYPMASLTETVPVLACNGLTKKFICPGWRVGWITIHDRDGILEEEIRPGLISLSQRILGPNALVQGAIPTILSTVPRSFFDGIIATVHANAKASFDIMSGIPGLSPIMPAGAMYMMTRIDMEHFPEFEDDLSFTSQLVSEQSVFCLPGQCFDFPGYFRIVLTIPAEKMNDALSRIGEFCRQHFVPLQEPFRLTPYPDEHRYDFTCG